MIFWGWVPILLGLEDSSLHTVALGASGTIAHSTWRRARRTNKPGQNDQKAVGGTGRSEIMDTGAGRSRKVSTIMSKCDLP
jgi:hypothetical protein